MAGRMPFKLATCQFGRRQGPALVVAEAVADIGRLARRDLPAAMPAGARSLGGPGGLLAILRGWDSWLPRLQDLANLVAEPGRHRAALEGAVHPLSSVRLRAPLQYPGKILCAGSNYYDHIREMGDPVPDKSAVRPFFFLKAPTTCVIGPGDAIRLPAGDPQVDWEIELAVVIGRRGRDIPAREAYSYVAGYTILNDVSARAYTVRSDVVFGFDWLAQKCRDTFAPTGPFIVPKQFVPEPASLGLRLWVNGELMQDSSTRNLIFKPDELIEYVSAITTLEPGDVIATGTPAGVGKPRGRFLKRGDLVVAEIEAVGRLENPVE